METRTSENRKLNVLIADSSRIGRDYLEKILNDSGRYTVVESTPSAGKAPALCQSLPVDIAVIDELTPGGMSGIAAAAQIKSLHPTIRLIVTTASFEDALEEKARAAGAESFWYKNCSREDFIEIVDRTAAGESVYPDAVPDGRIGDAKRSDFSRTELTILRAMMNGETAQQISASIGMSPDGVRYHIKSMLKKTGLPNRTALLIGAARLGIVVN